MKYLVLLLPWLASCRAPAQVPRTLASVTEEPELEVITLQRAEAATVAEFIRFLCAPDDGVPSPGFCALYPPDEPMPVPDQPLVVEVDACCNTVIVVGSARCLADARDLATRFDEGWEQSQASR